MRCTSCRGDKYVIIKGSIGCANCGLVASLGVGMTQLVLPDDPCVTPAAVQAITLYVLQAAFIRTPAYQD